MGFGPLERLGWPGGGIAVTTSQLTCMADAGLDCTKALDCISAVSPTDCSSPTWSCDGDTLTRCDSFAGSRVVTEDCAAAGLHCVVVGNEARCGIATCDPKSFAGACVDERVTTCQPVQAEDGSPLGGVSVVAEDCGAEDATCSAGANGADCVGNGPPCSFGPNGPLRCDGDTLVTCDASDHEERIDCTASGLRCVALGPNPAGFQFACASHAGIVTCTEDNGFGQCNGTTIEYCDNNGNQTLDCKSLGYGDCTEGHCVP